MNVASVPPAPATILIIEDLPANLTLLAESLGAKAYRVLAAQDGEEGLRRAEAAQPDLILLDVMMPGLDGFAVCRRLKANTATRRIPVIFMTALGELEDKLTGFAAGGVDYVAKPLLIPEVLARVQTHLELSALRGQLTAQNQELMLARHELVERVQSRTAALRAEIEERKRAELELQRSSEQIHDLYNRAPCGYHSLDHNGVFVRINDTELNWLGYSRDELIGKRALAEFLTPKSARLFTRVFPLVKQRGWVRDIELQLIRRDGSHLPVLLSATAVQDAAGQFVMTRATLYDLSERKQTEELIQHVAHHDALTGLSNRTVLQDQLGQLIAQARRAQDSVATMFLGLDQFNQINDAFDHYVGDIVLREISRRLSRCLREGDALARWGGDEFVVALAAPEVRRASKLIAEQIQAAMREPIVADGHELTVTCGIGISVYPADGHDVQALLGAAGTAMSHAKEKGPGAVEFFRPTLTANAQRRVSLAAQLRQAVARNELSLQYQPQVQMDSGEIFGAEALLRWQRPGLGAVSPAEFIPIAEESGLIQTLGEWVLWQSCEQVKRWRDAGHDTLTLAVNLSERQLFDSRFVDRVARALDETGYRAQALELEITETLLLQPNDESLLILSGLSDMGIQLTVDDCGMSSSNLSYLQSFPVHAVKIDRTFINRIGRKLHDDAVVSAIIAMAHSLNLRVLAEGVETTEQVAFLRARGCRAAQGYYYSQPVAPARFSELLGKSVLLGDSVAAD